MWVQKWETNLNKNSQELLNLAHELYLLGSQVSSNRRHTAVCIPNYTFLSKACPPNTLRSAPSLNTTGFQTAGVFLHRWVFALDNFLEGKQHRNKVFLIRSLAKVQTQNQQIRKRGNNNWLLTNDYVVLSWCILGTNFRSKMIPTTI